MLCLQPEISECKSTYAMSFEDDRILLNSVLIRLFIIDILLDIFHARTREPWNPLINPNASVAKALALVYRPIVCALKYQAYLAHVLLIADDHHIREIFILDQKLLLTIELRKKSVQCYVY